MELDIQANRHARKYSTHELALRVAWACALPLYRLSPRLLYGWRNLLLRLFGARIGRGARIHPRARIYFPWQFIAGNDLTIGEDVLVYNLGTVTLGHRVTLSHGVQLCAGTHDYNQPDFPLRKPPVAVGDDAWVCTEAFVGPGVTVGAAAVVGARAVVTRDVEPAAIMAGNPAQRVGTRRIGVA